MHYRLDSIFSSCLIILAVIAVAIAIPRDHTISAANAVVENTVSEVDVEKQPEAEESAELEKVGRRPYEMDWAGRTEEEREPLIDFEDVDGWTVKTVNSVASFERTREEQMFGQYVGKLTYRQENEEGDAPRVDVLAPKPLAIPEGADALSCWVYGDIWAWIFDWAKPHVQFSALFLTAEGSELSLPLETICWEEWCLIYRPIEKAFQESLGDGAQFLGFRVEGGTNLEDRPLYIDSLCFFKEELNPIDIPLRAKPGIDLFEGQPLGINSGEGRLSFPTTPDTILPDSSKNLIKPAMHFYGNDCDFVYEGTDGTLVYKYVPNKGDWSDLTVTWNFCEPINLAMGGGVVQLVGENGAIEDVERAELLELKPNGQGMSARWKLSSKTATATVEYRFGLRGKSLVVDTLVQGGNVPEVCFGRLENIVDARVFTIPYYLYDYGKRPATAIVRPHDSDVKLFVSGHIDWYRSGASYLRGEYKDGTFEREVRVGKPGEFKKETRTFEFATINGAAEYRTKTDGKRNDVYERFIFTVSPEFSETLQSIPNPKSPYRSVAGTGVWNARGANDRDQDKKYWREIWRYGMRHLIITDHETCWRDGGESFTFRTKPAPGKGGDEGWIDYSRFMQDELGFVYGPYNNFTDFAPVNEYWSPDMINRLPNNTLQHAWARCYAPKPTRAVDFCERLTPLNQEKFKFSCAYCDVHSSVPPWTRTDYDPRVPGAGTFMSVFYPYGEIFLIQKKNWQGPTYSEGPHHSFYAGLTDGNYGQDQPYNMFMNPWLVDFDLLKLHEQEVDFGMGNVDMFAPGYRAKNGEETEALLDRFLAATLAFGHSGYLALELGREKAARSYYMIQQIAARYTQTSVDTIRYIDADGNQLDTSAALKADVVKRSQLYVRYQDGTVIVANGSKTEKLQTEIEGRKIELSPNGYLAWTADKQIYVESSLGAYGSRFDYCESPEYIYVNGRDHWTRQEKACGYGSCVCRILGDGKYEIIPQGGPQFFGFKICGENETATAVALDFDQKELGEANVKFMRGYLFVMPIEGAVSYIVTVKPLEGEPRANWISDNFEVIQGDTINVSNGTDVKPWTAPTDLGWTFFVPDENHPECGIDFLVVQYAGIDLSVINNARNDEFSAKFLSLTPDVNVCAKLEWNDAPQEIFNASLPQGVLQNTLSVLPAAKEVGEEKVEATVELSRPNTTGATSVSNRYELTFNNEEREIFLNEFDFMNGAKSGAVTVTPYAHIYGKSPSCDLRGTGATYVINDVCACGKVEKSGYFIHPPYETGPGRTFLRFHFQVPDEPTILSLNVGKKDGSDPGDGIYFQVAVAQFENDQLVDGSEKPLGEATVTEHCWKPIQVDLTDYAGQTIDLLVISSPRENSVGDWACASDIQLKSKQKRIVRALKDVRKIQ